MKLFILIFILLNLTTVVQAQTLPNPTLTPGVADPKLTKDILCSPSFHTRTIRDVDESEKKKVFTEYNTDWSALGISILSL